MKIKKEFYLLGALATIGAIVKTIIRKKQHQVDNINKDSSIKEYIYDKMLNSIDYFISLDGEFVVYDYNLNLYDTVQYKVRLDDRKTYERVFGMENQNEVDYETIFDNSKQKLFRVNNIDKTLRTITTSLNDNDFINDRQIKSMNTNNRIVESETGAPVIYLRQDNTFLRMSRQSLLPQEMTFGFLGLNSNWDVSGFEDVADRNCVIIKGALSDKAYSKKVNTKNFTFWVDYNTGFLLKYIRYSKDGKISATLDTNYIKVNTTIDNKEFERDILDYKQINQF